MEMICSKEKDEARIALFPSLDYTGLYNVLCQLMDLLPHVQSAQILASSLLNTFCCLIPFLTHEDMDPLPYIVANTMALVPTTLHKEMVDVMCFHMLPFTVFSMAERSKQQPEELLTFSNISVPSVLMMTFIYAENQSLHTQLLETLMKLKVDVSRDLYCVIAYGTVKARCPAVELLFQYWPQLNPSAVDRKALSEKHTSWAPQTCQYEKCSNSLSNEAVKMCIDHKMALGSSGDRAPPILICIDCADQIYRGRVRDTLVDILLPIENVAYTCENKACKSPMAQRVAYVTCFSIECCMFNVNKPTPLLQIMPRN